MELFDAHNELNTAGKVDFDMGTINTMASMNFHHHAPTGASGCRIELVESIS
jgi:hypothetical protein